VALNGRGVHGSHPEESRRAVPRHGWEHSCGPLGALRSKGPCCSVWRNLGNEQIKQPPALRHCERFGSREVERGFGSNVPDYGLRAALWRGVETPSEETPWANRLDADLVTEAQTGLRGQGALVEMMRRLKDTLDKQNRVNTCLTYTIIGLMIVQIAVAAYQILSANVGR